MVTKIIIEIDGKKIVIPADKAKELYEQLKSVFGDEPGVEYVPYYVSPPYTPPTLPEYKPYAPYPTYPYAPWTPTTFC